MKIPNSQLIYFRAMNRPPTEQEPRMPQMDAIKNHKWARIDGSKWTGIPHSLFRIPRSLFQ
jgi:hypothetical protein